MKLSSAGFAILEHDTHISRWVEESGRLDHDRYALPIILEHISPGDVVVDAGAFIGDHTFAYCDAVGEFGTVHAFEPNPEAYECLTYNCPSARTYNVGLSNKKTKVNYAKDPNAGASRIVADSEDTLAVSTITLDSLKLPRLDFFKLDIEGYELYALKGALHTLRRTRPKLWIEINCGALAQNSCTPSDVTDLLESLGYSCTPYPEVGEQYDILCVPHEN